MDTTLTDTFGVLATIAEATLAVGRLSLWCVLDPASILLWILKNVNKVLVNQVRTFVKSYSKTVSEL